MKLLRMRNGIDYSLYATNVTAPKGMTRIRVEIYFNHMMKTHHWWHLRIGNEIRKDTNLS